MDIPLELSLWGVAGIVAAITTKLSGVAVYPEFENPTGFPATVLGWHELNEKGVFKVDFGLYTIDSFANIFSAGMDLITTFFGLTFYCTRV